MTSQRRILRAHHLQPDVYFLPLELRAPKHVRGLDVEMVCRRIPDCLRLLINNGEAGPTGTVAPEPPELEEVRAVVTGTLDVSHEGFELELRIHFRPDPEPIRSMTLSVPVSLRRPMPALTRLASRLAGILEIPIPAATRLTPNPRAFYRFLAGLDGSVPLSEALSLDPGFGLALRVAHARLVAAMEQGKLDPRACRRLLDDCLAARPTDGEACAQVAELLQRLGEEERALAWLEHAVRLPGPPAPALEALGLLARQGDPDRARALWQQGADLDGHPDFSAHLARLAFDQGHLDAGWMHVASGLRRIQESLARRQQWPVDRRSMGRLLGWLAGAMGTHQPAEEISDLLRDLRGRLPLSEERVELGRCLEGLGLIADARAEVQSALAMDLALETRDRAVRVMLALDVPGFEGRFRAAAAAIRDGSKPARGMSAMREFMIRQPEFWPGLFHLAIGFKRQGREDEALDALAEVLQMRPGHAETLVEMADLFARRGNPKRALECVDEALESHGWAELHLRRADYLEQLDRAHEAAAAVDRALELRKLGADEWREATEASV